MWKISANPREEVQFLLMHSTVGLGDMEEPVDNIFEHRAILIAGHAKRRQLLGIGLIARNVLTGEIVKPGDVLRLVIGKLENIAERRHFSLGDDAVGFCHLGGQRDHGDGKRHLAAGFRITFKQRPHSFDDTGERIARRGDDAEDAIPE